MAGYWKDENKNKLQHLLNKGYTLLQNPVLFKEMFPGKSPEAIARAIRRHCTKPELADELTAEEIIETMNPQPEQLPKILIFDIETAPMEVYAWELFKQYINPSFVIKDWSILSWAAKWLCDSEIMSEVATIEEAMNRDDQRITEKLWDLIDEADIIVAHNLKYFDLKKINTRFLVHEMEPPSPYETIDTLAEAKKHFSFSSNKLNYINKQLGLRTKIETRFSLWQRCVTGDKSALLEMQEYNKRDILALEDLYFKLRPWIKNHPNLGLYVESYLPVCPNCGSYSITPQEKYYHTPAGKYRAFRCDSCGAIGRQRSSSYPSSKSGSLLRSVAR